MLEVPIKDGPHQMDDDVDEHIQKPFEFEMMLAEMNYRYDMTHILLVSLSYDY